MATASLPIAALPGQAQVALTPAPPDATAEPATPPKPTQASEPDESWDVPQPGEASGPSPVLPPADDPNRGLRLPPSWARGFPIQQVFIDLANSTGDAERDEELKLILADAFIQPGVGFSALFADQALNQVKRLPFVAEAEYRLYQGNRISTVIVALLVRLQPEPAEAPPTARQATGMWVSGSVRDFPTIYQSDRSLVKVISNGGLGLFSDTSPWFGRSDVYAPGPYEPTGTVTWGEYYLEPGIAGITQIGDWPLYIYGEASYMLSGTVRPDIFRTDSRFYSSIEDLYGGVLWAKKGSPGVLTLSAGRQIFQLNDGFLFSQFSGSANALNRGASYLNPRTAYDMTVLADLRWRNFRLRGFFLEPDELPIADTNTQYLGTSFSYNNNQGLEAVLSYITVPQSDQVYVLPNAETFTRQGLQVINPRLRHSTLFGVSGLWAEAEYAYQFSTQRSMSAQGGYVWLGFTGENLSWKPTISYVFSGFSGDNPKTSTYERFDPLQAGGLGDWLQGINLGKIYNNSNSFSHRLTFQAQPAHNLSLSLSYFYRWADQLNNLGARPALSTLESRYIGQELLLVTQYFLSKNFMLQGVGAVAFPGSALRQAANNNTSPWLTLQLSLFMFF